MLRREKGFIAVNGLDEDSSDEEPFTTAADKSKAGVNVPDAQTKAISKKNKGGSGNGIKKRKAPAPPPNPEGPASFQDGWTVHPPSLIYKANSIAQGGTKIAAVDLDGTLITRRSGLPYALNSNDWQFFNQDAVNKLKEAVKAGYQVIIFSNQDGIGNKLLGAASTKKRALVDRVLNELQNEGVPAQCMMATKFDQFRTPQKGMWEFFLANLNNGVAPNLAESFYVGGSVGSLREFGDTSDSHRAFAANLGLKFYLTEEYFGEPCSGLIPRNNDNVKLVNAFHELSSLYHSKHEEYRSATYFNVAIILSEINFKVTSVKQVKDIDGIGISSQQKIKEFLEDGKIAVLEDLILDSKNDEAANKMLELIQEAQKYLIYLP